MSPVLSLDEVAEVPHGRTARRLTWEHLPPEVRAAVEERLGTRVVAAESMGAGFTPGFASRLTGADGTRVFLKAANTVAQRPIADSYREEGRKLALLPPGLPMPRPLWRSTDGPWVLLAFACLEGANPERPWREDQLAACLAALTDVAAATSTVDPALGLEPLHVGFPGLLTGWDTVRALEPGWPHLAEAAGLTASYADLPADRFVHADARDDNFVMAPDGRALLVDWNWPALAPVWVDVVAVLVSAHGDGLDADRLLADHPLTADVPADELDAFLAALTGFMTAASERTPPASSPFLRVHAAWYAAAGWSWLARRRGWS